MTAIVPGSNSQKLRFYNGALSTNEHGAPDMLEKYVKEAENDSTGYWISVLLQITYCLQRLHQEEIACEDFSHAKVLLLKNPSLNGTGHGCDTCKVDDKKNNIRSLADIYSFVLSNGLKPQYTEDLETSDLVLCADSYLALDLIRQMAEDDLTIPEILNHPFHWGDSKKVHFLCKATEYVDSEYINASKDHKNLILMKYDMLDANNILPGGKWIDMLRLRKKELMHIKQNQAQKTPVSEDLIRDLVLGNQFVDKAPVFALAKVFRNRYVHRHEDSEDVKLCFGDDYPTGYLKFYCSRFPNFFSHIYKSTKKHMVDNGDYKEFELDEFFSKPSCNVCLCIRSNICKKVQN